MSAYGIMPSAKAVQIDEFGQVIESKSYDSADSGESKYGQVTKSVGSLKFRIVTVIAIFLIFNIPTLISLAIYFGCRQKFRKKKLLEKMNLQDLE